jgi:hypothetical protein
MNRTTNATSEESFLIRYSGRKAIRFRLPASDSPMSFTISPHIGDAIVTITPAKNATKPPAKTDRDILSQENIQGVLGVLRKELARRDRDRAG